jgi:archaellum component FlaC
VPTDNKDYKWRVEVENNLEKLHWEANFANKIENMLRKVLSKIEGLSKRNRSEGDIKIFTLSTDKDKIPRRRYYISTNDRLFVQELTEEQVPIRTRYVIQQINEVRKCLGIKTDRSMQTVSKFPLIITFFLVACLHPYINT